MYVDRRLRRSKETKVRLNEPVEALAKREAEKHGMQLAVWVRYVVEKDLAEKGYEFPAGEFRHTQHDKGTFADSQS